MLIPVEKHRIKSSINKPYLSWLQTSGIFQILIILDQIVNCIPF